MSRLVGIKRVDIEQTILCPQFKAVDRLNHFQFTEITAIDGFRTMVVEGQIRYRLTVHLNVLLDYLNTYAAARVPAG